MRGEVGVWGANADGGDQNAGTEVEYAFTEAKV